MHKLPSSSSSSICFACTRHLLDEHFYCPQCVTSMIHEFHSRIKSAERLLNNKRLQRMESKELNSKLNHLKEQSERIQLHYSIYCLNRRVEELKLAVKQRKHIRYTIYQIYTCKETKAVRVKQKAIKQRRERLLSELATIQSQRRSPSLKLNEYEDKRQRMGSLLVQTSQSQSILLGELFKIYGFQLCDIVLPTTDPMPSPTYRFLTFNPVSIKYQTPELRVQTNAILMQLARLIELISRYLDQDLPFNFQLRPNGHLYLTTGYAVDSFALPLFASSRRPFVWFELSLVFLSYSLASLCWRLGNCGTSTTNVGVFDWLHAALLQTTKQPRDGTAPPQLFMEFSEYLEIAVERLDIGRMLADSPPKLKQSVISFLAEYGVARTDDDVMAPISVHSEIGEKTTLQQTLAAEERVEDWNIVDELQLLPPEPSAGDEELLIWQQLSKS